VDTVTATSHAHPSIVHATGDKHTILIIQSISRRHLRWQ